MKKLAFVLCCVVALAAASCSKEKTCRCSVPDSQTVHVIKIEKGSCESLNTMHYSDQYTHVITDSLFCVEYDN